MLRAVLLGGLCLLPQQEIAAQQPQWQPSRMPASAGASQQAAGIQSAFLSKSRPTSSFSSATNAQPTVQLGSGVVLRWKSPSESNPDLSHPQHYSATDAFASEASTVQQALVGGANPLRLQVRQAAYQQDRSDMFSNPFVNDPVTPPALPQGNAIPVLPSLPSAAPRFIPPGVSLQEPSTPRIDPPNQLPPAIPADPLSTPELPPPPSNFAPSDERRNDAQSGSILENQTRPSPFPPRPEDAAPRDRGKEPELISPPDGAANADRNSLQRLNNSTNFASCDELRSRIYTPLSSVSLDVSPAIGEGLISTKQDFEKRRLDFAASAEVRDWTDYRGDPIASGRLIDLRDGRVIIDVDGAERAIPMRDLSDVDVAYVGESWNIPERCGTGYEPFMGRNFVASTVQWKASGLCHKPLYFEQVQLERYGHEIGPVLQPLVSTAHFFGNIPLLPYKMGIHPPNECQYPLGYFRSGSCAPYMLQPIPWSLRGAAVQAGVVTGAAALIP